MLILTVITMTASAQRFFNLTADEVHIDTVMPTFVYSVPLEDNYADSVYNIEIRYPEFLDMSPADTLAYSKLAHVHPGVLPEISHFIAVQQHKGSLVIKFVPVVYRNGKYQYLVSFMLAVTSKCRYSGSKKNRLMAAAVRKASVEKDIYAQTSVLSKGAWAKIRVPQTGVYQLTQNLVSQAGFSDISKVKIYGYGGNLQNDTLVRDELQSTDDLKEVPTCTVGGKRLFYAKGPVSWSSTTATVRTRNPYSDYGYYFLTQDDESAPASVDSAAFVGSFYPATDDYHSIHEVDDYAWYEMGRNLVEASPIKVGASKTYTVSVPEGNKFAVFRVVVTSDQESEFMLKINDFEMKCSMRPSSSDDHACQNVTTIGIDSISATDSITITSLSGGQLRLDYITAQFSNPRPAPDLNGTFAAPEYVYGITNQNLHADSAYQMVIIYPTNAKLKEQAERLAAYHRTRDNMTVRVVPADEIFNEFSSGTPDANAYRRYMKMLYDRADGDTQKAPKYLLLFGDGTFDNRMNTSTWSNSSPDDYLLCYESENSFSETESYVNDGFFCALDDGEGADPRTDLLDIASGRFPVSTAEEAKVMVDKCINYMNDTNVGPWVNTCMFLADDGNNNLHMEDAESCAEEVEQLNSGMYIRRVYEDAYKISKSATGNTYPEATAAIKKQVSSGALLFNYNGHGGSTQMADEKLLLISDFENFRNKNLPLWFTASCNIMPFDRHTMSIGETAVLNSNGGAVGFIGTSRTVYADRNRSLDLYFLDAIFTKKDSLSYYSIGEALRLAKNALVTNIPIHPGLKHGSDNSVNKLHYTLLGDPAMHLHMPTLSAVVDSINGVSVKSSQRVTLSAGSKARIKGHIVRGSSKMTDFDGTVSATVRDTQEDVVCLINQPSVTSTAFTYKDRTKIIFNGTDSVLGGQFDFSFAVPMDINYADESGLVNLCAISTDKEIANGSSDAFDVGGTGAASTDSIGPSVYCYLNSPEFRDGGDVNKTPYFHADITDRSGINTSGSGIGHDLQLIVDGDKDLTFNLNDNFMFETGSYTTGSTYYTLPELTEGRHILKFRAWDILNNSTTTQLSFNVVGGLAPNIISVDVTKNPTSGTALFIITHNFSGSLVDAEIEIFDMTGRLLQKTAQQIQSEDNTVTVDCGSLRTGVYLYRANVSSDGSTKSSKAKKLIIINN